MEWWKMIAKMFLRQYVCNPRKIGAVYPSSGFLADKMLSGVHFQSAKYIVEYGPGTGVFTDKIMEYRNLDTIVMLIESNEEFYQFLKEKYKNESNIIIIKGSAENIDRYVKEYRIPYVDYVISGLPFTSLPKNVSDDILFKTKEILGNNGKFITFQYTLLKKSVISQFFNQIDISHEYRNIPPAFVLNCKNEYGKGCD